MITATAAPAPKPATNGAPPPAAAEVPQDTPAKPPLPAAAATMELTPAGEVVAIGFDTVQGFNALQRVAKLFSASQLIPAIYQNNIANCSIALEMAFRMKASPLMVMQNLYIVHGNPGWSSKFLIASFNQCGRFTAIKYRWCGERGKPTWGCKAYAKEKATGEEVEGPTVTWLMAKAEGWVDKKGSKWLTMPDLMFMYRSAAFLVRTTAPELTMGLPTAEEVEDLGDVPSETAAPHGVAGLKSLLPPAQQEDPHDPATGEVKAAAGEEPAAGAEPSAEEQAEIRAQEAAEAAAAQK
jgi:hypothetical protein